MGKMFNQKNHHRKSIRLREYDYTNPNWYYITICSYKRENIFGKVEKNKMILNKEGEIVEQEWLKIKELRKNIDLDYYVVMPNHFHGIVIIESRDKASLVPTEERRFGKPVAPIWQKNYYEHIIRNEMDLFYIRRYIELNPLKWELDEYYSS